MTASIWPAAPYYLRDKNGEPLFSYADVLDGKEALDKSEPGTELIRACDGAVLGRRDKTDPMNHPTPHWGTVANKNAGLSPEQVLRKLRQRHGATYTVIESDGTTLVESAQDADTAFMASPKEGRTIQKDGVVRYVARDGGWVWSGVRTA